MSIVETSRVARAEGAEFAAPNKTMVELFREAVDANSDLIAFECRGQTLTFQQVWDAARNVAAFLQQELKVRKGDRVALVCPNVLSFPVAALAVFRTGAFLTTVNPAGSLRSIKAQLIEAEASVILVHSDAWPQCREAMLDTPVKKAMVLTSQDFSSSEQSDQAPSGAYGFAYSFRDAIEAGETMELQPVELAPSDVALLQLTGGTGLRPKLAMLTHANITSNVKQCQLHEPRFFERGRDVILTALPLYHVFGLVFNFMMYFSIGAKNILIPDPGDMDHIIDECEKESPTVFTGTNNFFANILKNKRFEEFDFKKDSIAFGGGAAITQSVWDRWKAKSGAPINLGYGLTETSPVVCYHLLGQMDHAATSGTPLPGTRVKVVDTNGLEVEVGDYGEFCVAGPQVMRGYWRRDVENDAAFTADGFFRTGDIAQLGADGVIRIIERKTDVIHISGFQVFPNEVETVVSMHPDVSECACVSVESEEHGEVVGLFAVPMRPGAVTPEDLDRFCRKTLSPIAMPRKIWIIDELPRSPVGKIRRQLLRNLAGWDSR